MALIPRNQDFSAWYNELIDKAWLAQNSAVRGCMVIKPYGFAIRENMRDALDQAFKDTGHRNAYFPLFIPKSFFTKEAKHVEGFATESAIVTHYRLKKNDESGEIEVDPDAKLEEELIVRPTSETIIWNTYKDRIQSYRDLPILVNQRANVVRREMRTRAFLRTAEFLWQEWHTAHATADEAMTEAKKMREVYARFQTNILAVQWVMGEKSESERFAGAENTYTIERMMQDGKALQSCTSHYLGQNFGKAFDVQFTNKDNTLEYAYATSRGLSTRALGGMIMSHSDDAWLILPPMIAPVHIQIIPIYKKDEDLQAITDRIQPLVDQLSTHTLSVSDTTQTTDTQRKKRTDLWLRRDRDIVVNIDTDEHKSMGRKMNQYELEWVPLTIVVGARDMEKWHIVIKNRLADEKVFVSYTPEDAASLAQTLADDLRSFQHQLLHSNITLRQDNTVTADTREEFTAAIEGSKFVLAHRDGTMETEELIKQETKATIRCIPDTTQHPDYSGEAWHCIKTWQPSTQRVLFAKAY